MTNQMEAIRTVECSTAEEFLSQFNCDCSLWNGQIYNWVFRGHSNDGRYKLIPTSLRDDSHDQLGYTHESIVKNQPKNRNQIDAEFHRIHEFYWALDRQGLKIPGENHLFRTPSGWTQFHNKIEDEGWPIDDLLPLLALAQHYGISTRLLDWSDKPLVAAFFAAKSAAKKAHKKNNAFISIWALDLKWVIQDAFPGENNSEKLSVYIVTAPRASNPNLHAQGGVFTTEPIHQNEFEKKVTVSTVDEVVKGKWDAMTDQKTVMLRIKLPISESSKLLRLLSQLQINSATLFPGYHGVVASLEEKQYWDKQEQQNYWLTDQANRVAGGISPPAPTPPSMRVRTGRFMNIIGP